MNLTREKALAQLRAWTKTESLLNHARAVEIVMRRAAHQYGGEGADEEAWGIAGLVHDADYEQWPEEHPKRVVDWLRAEGADQIAYAVSVHQTKWGLPAKTEMDKALLACDELAGFVIACCLVRPDGILSLAPKSVKKKLKDKSSSRTPKSSAFRARADYTAREKVSGTFCATTNAARRCPPPDRSGKRFLTRLWRVSRPCHCGSGDYKAAPWPGRETGPQHRIVSGTFGGDYLSTRSYTRT